MGGFYLHINTGALRWRRFESHSWFSRRNISVSFVHVRHVRIVSGHDDGFSSNLWRFSVKISSDFYRFSDGMIVLNHRMISVQISPDFWRFSGVIILLIDRIISIDVILAEVSVDALLWAHLRIWHFLHRNDRVGFVWNETARI